MNEFKYACMSRENILSQKSRPLFVGAFLIIVYDVTFAYLSSGHVQTWLSHNLWRRRYHVGLLNLKVQMPSLSHGSSLCSSALFWILLLTLLSMECLPCQSYRPCSYLNKHWQYQLLVALLKQTGPSNAAKKQHIHASMHSC